ncbi:hypothetical protein NUBL21985_54560 [Klebsiella pneumoniae]|nr:hypothetical protein NUBL21985_54560 [Klebsiella pneumoniae]GKM34200.1 hypothetical protein NUBL21996_45600 [Klebsiella pneumoniae]
MRRLQVTQAQIQGGDQLQELRQISDVKKWEMNQAAGRYICSHKRCSALVSATV